MRTMPTHIQFGIIQRSKGQCARARQAYQMCGRAKASTGKIVDFTRHAADHLGTVILLPENSNRNLLEPINFIRAIKTAENRSDAQECRTLDFDLPRGIEREDLIVFASFIVAPLVERGMAIQIDVECPDASDGLPHPHAHCIVAMRHLAGDRFGSKARDWNIAFRAGNGREMRLQIASRISLAAAYFGLDTIADPRPAKHRAAYAPMPRLPPSEFKRKKGTDIELLGTIRIVRAKALFVESTQSNSLPKVASGNPWRPKVMTIKPVWPKAENKWHKSAGMGEAIRAFWHAGFLSIRNGNTTKRICLRDQSAMIEALAAGIAERRWPYVAVDVPQKWKTDLWRNLIAQGVAVLMVNVRIDANSRQSIVDLLIPWFEASFSNIVGAESVLEKLRVAYQHTRLIAVPIAPDMQDEPEVNPIELAPRPEPRKRPELNQKISLQQHLKQLHARQKIQIAEAKVLSDTASECKPDPLQIDDNQESIRTIEF